MNLVNNKMFAFTTEGVIFEWLKYTLSILCLSLKATWWEGSTNESAKNVTAGVAW